MLFLKKNIYYLLTFLIIVAIIETFSLFAIKLIKNNPLIKKSMNFHKSIALKKELNSYIDLIPYIDGEKSFKFINTKKSKDLFYETLRDFNEKNSENILIQGDSWAAAANNELIKIEMIKFANKMNFGIINAGKISYSISPMTIQLEIFLKKFKLKPSMIIAILDQTDLGDEIHRYQSLSPNSLNLQDTRVHNEFKKSFFKILESKNINFIKLLKLFNEFWNSRLVQFNYDYSKTIKYIFKRLYYLATNTHTVIAPLKYGLNLDEKKIIINRVEKYIDFVFKNDIKKIVFVTHPHKEHLKNKLIYKENISLILNEIINNSQYSNKINHINFNKDFKKIYKNLTLDKIFIEEDPTSHLTQDTYLKIFYPHVIKNCCLQ